MARTQRVGGWIGGIFVGLIAGFAALFLYPGALSWSPAAEAQLFLEVAIPVALAEYFGNRYLIRRIIAGSTIHVSRLAIVGKRLYVGTTSGDRLDRPLNDVMVSRAPIAAGWYAVGLTIRRRAPLTFYVSAELAEKISSAKG